ncbi:cytochrome P450 82A3-like [Papaver somniferum]|uniref:cytochrome P450 82A3-like n=1 Tax=Papaver somniferum TaxID=3469 RepID=UPI000E6FAFA4|nr:cytochrome P450 82A3-like [Papaver somniferum]
MNLTPRMVITKKKKKKVRLYMTIKEFFTLLGVPVASDVFPFLGWLDVDGQKKRMKRVAKEMNSFAKKWLEEHKQKKGLQMAASNNGGDKANDFMDVLISVLDEENEDLFAVHSRDTVIKSTCLSLILGSTQTTSVAMTWALSELLNNPNVLRKAKEEIDTKVGKDGNIEDRDIKDLVYLHAIVKETLRLHPPGPLSIPHEAIEDCIVNGYEVKAGTRFFHKPVENAS